ncbi:MAG: hypothetical protein QM765_20220 [Myxococcales bacterium]
MKTNHRHYVVILAAALLCAACDFRFDQPVAECQGSGCTTLAPDAGTWAGTELPDWPAAANACVTGDESPLFVGRWEGYYMGSEIGDEFSTVRLDIVGANATGLCGTLTFGIHTAPVTLPPATDPTSDYPDQSLLQNGWDAAPILGLPYTILGGKIDGHRTTFHANAHEIYRSWCEIQTSYRLAPNDNRYTCLPSLGAAGWTTTPSGERSCFLTNSETNQNQTVACSQLDHCNMENTCLCNSSGCTANDTQWNWRFDIVVNGDSAFGVFDSINLVLTRVTPSP